MCATHAGAKLTRHIITRHTKHKLLLRTLSSFLGAALFLPAPSSAFPRPFFAFLFASWMRKPNKVGKHLDQSVSLPHDQICQYMQQELHRGA